jgi:hypothetical protein
MCACSDVVADQMQDESFDSVMTRIHRLLITRAVPITHFPAVVCFSDPYPLHFVQNDTAPAGLRRTRPDPLPRPRRLIVLLTPAD